MPLRANVERLQAENYTSTMTTATLPTSPRRTKLWLLAVAALLLAVLGGILVVRFEGEESTAQETYRSLVSSTFAEELPLGIVLDRRSSRRLSGGDVLGRISFFDVRRTRGAEGGIVVISYEVYRSPEAAMTAYETYWRDLREANNVQKSGYRFFKTKIARPHHCVDEVQEFCKAVVGNVILEALSRIQLFEPDEPSHVGVILRGALRHIDRTTESG